jgi:hypothetical protein
LCVKTAGLRHRQQKYQKAALAGRGAENTAS